MRVYDTEKSRLTLEHAVDVDASVGRNFGARFLQIKGYLVEQSAPCKRTRLRCRSPPRVTTKHRDVSASAETKELLQEITRTTINTKPERLIPKTRLYVRQFYIFYPWFLNEGNRGSASWPTSLHFIDWRIVLALTQLFPQGRVVELCLVRPLQCAWEGDEAHPGRSILIWSRAG